MGSQHLPFSPFWPIFAGVLAGLLLRLVFSGKAGGPLAAMTASFILLAPVVVGAVTVYVAETQKRRSWGYYAAASFAANVFFVAGTLLVMIEGLICAVLIVPLFSLVGVLGGLVMGAICRVTNWPSHAAFGVSLLPMLLALVEHQVPLPHHISSVERTRLVAASPEQIWRQLETVHDIRPEEVGHAWMYRIGVPIPRFGVTEITPQGRVRHVGMGKGIHFDQVAAEWEPHRRVRWTYRFEKDSFPPAALDDHVMIGGHYFDLIDTEYTLTPQGSMTELSVRMQYRVSTQFNWYAQPIAEWLIGNFSEVILEFYGRRAQQHAGQSAGS